MPGPRDPVEDEQSEDLSSRSDVRRANRELEESLARLAKDLVALKERPLAKLDLPETLLDSITSAQAMKSPKARERQLRLVRTALREAEWSLIRARVDALVKHGALPASLATDQSAASRAPEWVARLLGEGTEAIEALVQAVPNADRTHLRNLIRLVKNASAERRKKAEERLTHAVVSLLR
jgi:ribosomal 50S subunit-associated protein YjgA (DUF615 family)